MRLPGRWLLFGVIVGTAVALQFQLPLPWPQLLAFLLIFVWPVFSWMRGLSGLVGERFIFSAALVIALNMLLVLLLAYWPGAMIRPYQLIGHVLLSVLPLPINPKTEPVTASKSAWLPILLNDAVR